MKKCFKCNEVKQFSEFYRHSKMPDGYLNKCKECAKLDARNNRARRIDYYREYDRRRSKLPHRLEQNKKVSREWRKTFPERRAAQIALGNAVRDGRVIPWPVCSVPECNDKPEAHHPDYSKPLSVVWLCPAHHKQVHAQARELEGRE